MADNFFDQFDRPAAPTTAQPASGNFFDQFDKAAGTAAAAAPVTYDAAEFQRRVGRQPENAIELANFAAQKGKGFAGDPSAVTAPGQSAVNDFATGVGISLSDTGRGIEQLYDRVADQLAPRAQGQPSRLQESQAEAVAANYRNKGTLATTAGKVGDLTGDVVQVAALPAAGLVGTGLRGTIAGGAALGATRPTTSPDQSVLANTAQGGAAGAVGYGAGAALGRLVQPIANNLSNTAQAAVNELRARGVPLDLAQQTGSRIAGFFKQLAGTETSALPEQQSQAFTRAALREVGEDSTAADPSTMKAARTRIGDAIDSVADNTPIKLDNQLTQQLASIRADASDELSAEQMTRVNKQLDNVLSRAANNGGEIPGQAYQTARSTLGRLSSNTQDASVGHWAGEIQDALDDALQRSASPEDLQTLLTARKQWRALKQIEPAINEDNQIVPSRLWQSVDTVKNASQVTYGTGDQSLVRLAQAGMQVLKNARPAPPQSTALNAVLAHTGMGAIAGGADYVHGGSLGQSLAAGAAGAIGSTALRAGATGAARLLVQNPALANRIAALGNSALAMQLRQLITQAGGRVAAPAAAGDLTQQP